MGDPDWRPAIRSDLLCRQFDHESVVWSPLRQDPVALDAIATTLLGILDGEATIAELIEDVHDVVGISRDLARSQVLRTVELLHDAGALTTSIVESIPERQRELFINPPST